MYIFIPDLKPGFIGLVKGNGKTRWETFKFRDLVRIGGLMVILEIMTGMCESNEQCWYLFCVP